MKRKLFCALLSLLLALALVPAAAAAQDADVDARLRQRILEAYTPEKMDQSRSHSAGEDRVMGETVSLEDLSVSIDTLHTTFFDLHDSGLLPWYAAGSFGYTYDEDSTVAKGFIPHYLDPDRYDRVAYEQKVAEILKETVHEGMDPWQAALSIHDYLASHYRYDESLTLFRGYDLLVGGSAVCTGYAEAYTDLLRRIGIECVMVSSEEMNHRWNLVKLHGNWYHVDVTWDDPTPDSAGFVSHQFFLVTDEEIRSQEEKPHYGWETEITCTDTAYQDGFWREVYGAINYPDSQHSYYRYADPEEYHTNIILREELTGDGTVLHWEEAQYMDLGSGSYYHYPNHGLTLWNGRLYFSNMDSVLSMAADGSDLRTEFSFDVRGNGQCIHSCFVDGGTLYLTLRNESGDLSNMEVTLENGGQFHTHSYTATVLEPTCTMGGFTTYVCGCGITVQENATPATGHRYDGGVTLREPSFTQPGEKQFTCIACGDSYTEEIAILEEILPDIEEAPEEGRKAWYESNILKIAVVLALLVIRVISRTRRRARSERS